ncbi:MAG: carboxypeptidase regulatory-like domain-containing protein [Acidobacteria bacterium]|nr:carboxypeptidase regulatory-like domain-containing protein [Acidobacteriota bacterium]
MRRNGIVTILALLCVPAFAQDFRATISGYVTDSSGAPIAGAKVRAVQTDTNQSTEAATNRDGFYTLPYLTPGTYQVEATAGGFKKFVRDNVSLLVAQKLDLGFRLEVGGIDSQITVTEEVDALQTGDASGGLNFDSTMVSEYPLNGRQIYMLLDNTPGVLFTQEQFGASGFSGTRGWDVNGSYVMNGGVQGTNSFSLNGAPVSLTGSWQVAPNADAVQEFKVMVNTYDAAIGRTGGGSVNTTIKSGSNRTSGTLFNYMRNSILDANYTQNNQVGAPRGKHITNQFGGTFGTAIRKNREFIFVSFEGFRERVPFPVVASVPPMDLRDGRHFTEYNMTIYDPLTGHACVSKVDVSGTCASTFIRNPFPGNVIPSSRISPAGEKILSFYPAPNTSGLVSNFVYANSTGKYRYDQPMVRWDRNFGDRDKVNAIVTFQHGQEYRNQTGIPGPAAGGNIDTQRTDMNFIASWTRILTPTAILDLRASFGRFTSYFPDANTANGVTAKDLGMAGAIHAPTSTGDFPPRILIDQFANLFGNGANLYTWTTDNQWNVVPTVTMTRGNRTIKFGADLVYAMRGSGSIGQANGQLSFTRYATQQYPLTAGATTVGSGIADVLLGIPGSGFVDWNDTYYRTWPYYGFFVQEDWKVRRNLTLNLGLRYDVQVPFVERWNRVNNGFDTTAKNPLSDRILAVWAADKAAYDVKNPTYPYPAPPAVLYGGKTFIGPGQSRRTYYTDWQNIQPRIGIAWSFTRGSVLRTGFGIFHRTATQANLTDGFSQQTAYTRSLNGDMTPAAGLTGAYSLANPFPDGLVAPTGSSLGLLTNVGNGVSYDGRQRLIPRTFQYSFGIQHMLPWALKLDLSYVGSITNHDTMTYNQDYLPMDIFLKGQAANSFLDGTVPNPFYNILPRNTTFGASPNIAARDLYRFFPLFNGVTENTNPWARYRYDALQLSVSKRFAGVRSRGGALTMVFAYTFSKNTQWANIINNWNLAEGPVHELVSYDKPQSVSYTGVWDLPFGHGRHFLVSTNKYVNGAIGGWTMNWIYRYTSGIPVAGIDAVNYCSPQFLVSNQIPGEWFNNTPNCYRARPNYTLRAVPDRYAWLRQMDNSSINLAGAKTFTFTERWRFNLRAEAFNLFNHPLYGAPDTTRTDVRFGMLPVGQQNFPRLIQVSAKLLF